MIIVGVDSSLTSTGFAIADTDAEDGPTLMHVTSVTTPPLPPRPPLIVRARRIEVPVAAFGAIVDHVLDLGERVAVVIEAKDFMAESSAQAHDRSGLWWRIVSTAIAYGCDVAAVAPGSLKLYATGNGRATKQAVKAVVEQRYRAVANDDESDAVVLAAMGCHAAGKPLAWVPDTHLRTLWATDWPSSLTREGTTTP